MKVENPSPPPPPPPSPITFERAFEILKCCDSCSRKTELNVKLYGETLKIYPQVKFLGTTFDSQLNFTKHFEDILDCCNIRYHRLRLLVNKKWGPSPATLIQIYKQCVRPSFEYVSVSTITASDNIISKIQQLKNKFIWLALRLPKYICSKLFYDPFGFPYASPQIELHKTPWSRSQYLPTSSTLLGTVSQRHYLWFVL